MQNFRRSDRYDRPSLFTDLKARRSSLYSIQSVQRIRKKSKVLLDTLTDECGMDEFGRVDRQMHPLT